MTNKETDKEVKEVRMFVGDGDDPGTDANTAGESVDSAHESASEAESFTSSIDANGRALNRHGRRGEDDPHSGCTTRAYLQDGQDYTGDNKKYKPEINFTDKNGFVTCRTCHAYRAHSETRHISDKVERKKAKAAKIKEWKDKARGGRFIHCGKLTNGTPRRGPDSDDEDFNGKDGSSGGGTGGALLVGH
ncbi:hypothetical protein LY78DRAFT_690046 [Colletotrichum sublineola]|nr:hypothetical protein LY78DRAFT_690046 [Colletotrichum sublineola]